MQILRVWAGWAMGGIARQRGACSRSSQVDGCFRRDTPWWRAMRRPQRGSAGGGRGEHAAKGWRPRHGCSAQISNNGGWWCEQRVAAQTAGATSSRRRATGEKRRGGVRGRGRRGMSNERVPGTCRGFSGLPIQGLGSLSRPTVALCRRGSAESPAPVLRDSLQTALLASAAWPATVTVLLSSRASVRDVRHRPVPVHTQL